MKAKKCEAAFPVIAEDGEHSQYFACTKKGEHRVHEARYWIYDGSGFSLAELRLKWPEKKS